MQDHQKHRPQDAHGPTDADDSRWDARGMGDGRDRQNRYGEGLSPGWTGDRAGYVPASPWDDRHPRPGGFAVGYGGEHGRDDRSREPDHSGRGHAPGGQTWEGQDADHARRGPVGPSLHDFEPDYLHWREQQMSSFDKDYSDWRAERREKFSSDFDTWRQSRSRAQAENPIVGDISDGGTGNAEEIKKR